MPNGFGYYASYSENDYYNDPSYYARANNYRNNSNSYLWGAAIAPFFGISPLVGLGIGALLGNVGSQNTNIININTRRRGCNY